MSSINHVIYFVVGDSGLNSGNGVYVADLEHMKARLLKMKPRGAWQLVISIHGTEDALATRGGFLRTRPTKGFYQAAEIRKLFEDDAAFRTWRETYGPTWVTLNACQVNQQFEAVVINSLNKPQGRQKPQGLGKGCRPLTTIHHYYDARKRMVTRQIYNRMSRVEKDDMLSTLSELNRKFGYFGGPPVPEGLLLDYFFDEEPRNAWPVVTVKTGAADTGISFYNRLDNARFLGDKCREHIGPMRPHIPQAPPAP